LTITPFRIAKRKRQEPGTINARYKFSGFEINNPSTWKARKNPKEMTTPKIPEKNPRSV